MKKELDPYKEIPHFYNGPSYQLNQGYMCNSTSCSKDKIKEMPINGHSVGQARKLFDKQLKLTALKIFDRFEEKGEFSERLAGFMHLGEGAEIPSPAQIDKFIELMHDAYVQSDNKHTVQPNIKGVPTGGDFLDKSEYWRLFMEENKTDEKKEEEKALAAKKVEEEKRKAAKEEEERLEKERKARLLEVRKKKYADKFGVSYREYDGYPYFEKVTEGVPGCVVTTLQSTIARSIYDNLKEARPFFPDEYPLLDAANSVLDWYNTVKDTEQYVSLEEQIMSRIDYKTIEDNLVRKEIQDIYNTLHTIYTLVPDFQGYLDSILMIFGKNVIRKLTNRELTDLSYSFEETIKDFINSNKFDIKDIEGSTKRLLLEFTDEFITRACEDEDLEEDTEQLRELFKNIREKMGEGTMLSMKTETKEYAKAVTKEGAKRGALRSLTKTVGRGLSEFIVKKGGGGSSKKDAASATRILAAFFETEEGRAVISVLAARGVPYVAEKLGKASVGAEIARELDTEAISVVTEKVTDMATMLAQLGMGEIGTLFNKFEDDPVDVSPKALPVSTVEPVPGMAREEELAGSGRR